MEQTKVERLVVKQALKIDDLKKRMRHSEKLIKTVLLKITCIGAPLNDNMLHYSKEQLKIFIEIQEILSA